MKKTAPAVEPLKLATVAAAFKEAGYKTFRALPKTIRVEVPGAPRDAAGNKAVEPIQVHDLAVGPGILVVDRNWPAIAVAKKLDLAFREFQFCGEELFLRDVRNLAE